MTLTTFTLILGAAWLVTLAAMLLCTFILNDALYHSAEAAATIIKDALESNGQKGRAA